MVKETSKLNTKAKLAGLTLVLGTVIGAGVLGLPYLFAKAGYITGLVNLIIVGFAVSLMTLYVGELALRTKEKHQLAGFAAKYLGDKWKYVMLLVETIGIYTALIAYMIGIGTALSSIFGGSPLLFGVLFFVLASPVVYVGLRVIVGAEFIMTATKLIILLVLCIAIFPQINFSNVNLFDMSKIFLPFGIVLFASLGYTVIPELEEAIEKDKRQMKWVILGAMLITIAIYAFYTFVFVGVYGTSVNEIATISVTGPLALLGDIFVLFTMVTPFIALCTVVKDIYILDFKIPKSFGWFLACFIPFMIFLYGGFDFITLLGISGTYSGGLMGILSAVMILQARKMKPETKPQFIVPGGNLPIYFTILVFIGGIIYQTLFLLGFL
jgi:amino acid permease